MSVHEDLLNNGENNCSFTEDEVDIMCSKDGDDACRDDMFNTSEKFLEILCFRHFARHVEFSRTRKNGRKKQVVDSIEVSVILHMV